jgi:hypothetical protein
MTKRITPHDKDFILNNYLSMTDKEMSNVLHCSVKTIERHRASLGLSKRSSKTTKMELNSTLKEDDPREFFRKEFLLSVRGRRMQQQVSPQDWPVVVSEWCEYHMQLDDLTYTEENTIEQIITLKLRMDRNQKEYRDSSMVRDILTKENNISDIKDLDLTDPDEAALYEKIYSASLKMMDLNKEYKDLLDKATKLQEALNVTRKQREEKGMVGANTFFDLCKSFELKKNRDQTNRMTELFKVATEKNMEKLREGIEFMDGEIAPQLLDAETIRLMEKEKEND